MATFGKTNIGGTTDSSPGNFLLAVGKFSPASNGTVDSITLYCRAGSGSVSFTCGIYTDNGSTYPAAEVCVSAAGTSVSGDWVTVAVSGSPAITAGTEYWIAFNSANTGTINLFEDDDGANVTKYIASIYASGTLPDNFPGSAAENANAISIYVTYTETSTFKSRVIVIS